MKNPSNYISTTIADTETSTDAIDLNGKKLVGIEFPATMTGTTVSIQQCESEGGTYTDVYDFYGTAVSVPVVDGYIPVDPTIFVGPAFIKIVSDAAEGADRTLKAVCVDL